MVKNYTYNPDVLVIGGGGAGATAAIWASKRADTVCLIDKGIFGKSGCTVMGGFSMCAALGYADPHDSPEIHMKDTITKGEFINNQDLVKLFSEDAPEKVMELTSYGARFDAENGKLEQVLMPGHQFPRACHYKRKTGPMIMGTLVRKVQQTRKIETISETIIVDLITDTNGFHYAIGLRWSDSAFCIFRAKSIVIATGGGAQVYQHATTSLDNTGDGLSLIFEAGGELTDMEFIQFLPTAQCYPKLLGLGPTCPAFIRIRTNAKLYNRFGEDFIEKAIPDWRFKATRDILSIYIYKEIIEGRGSEHGGVFMDVSFLKPEVIKAKLSVSNYYEKVLKSGVDLTKDSIEITTAAHYFMGGVRINARGETSIPGIFACGESAAGFHGANRLGGNSLSEILVSGSLAGKYAAKKAVSRTPAEENSTPTIKKRIDRIHTEINKWKSNKGGIRPVELKNKLRNMMWEKAGVIRDGNNLKDGINYLDHLKNQLANLNICIETQYNRDLLDAFELKHMMNVSELILSGALIRQESRGAHFRQDYPDKNNEKWLANIILKKDNGLISSYTKKVMLNHQKLQ